MELVGRDRELATSFRMLVEERRSVVTLWGPGGIGKTSLARVAQRRCGPSFEGGTHFAALAGARDQVDFLAIVADVLALGSEGATTAAEGVARVGRSLAARGRTLLVLDNVEQVVADAAAAVVTWSVMAPEASFLVTSRELLAIPGEQPCELLPLATEATGGAVPEAVRLLVDRARAVRPTFDAAPDVLCAIVARLDGIPLAIELAAARLAVMSAEQLLARLEDRFTVLRRGHGSAEQRQRTLHDAIDWSWNLLDPAERRVLAGLSVFRGFDLDAVAAVHGSDVIDTIAALRHKSLIAEGPVADRAGGVRFFLLQSIRDFAARELGDRTEDVRKAHGKYYADAATTWAAQAVGPDSDSALARLAVEHDNLLAVAECFHDAPAEALRAIIALEPLLTSRGAANQLALLLGRALAPSSPAVPRALRLRALEVQAATLLTLGHLGEAHAAGTSALELIESDLERARVSAVLGLVRQAQGDFTGAMHLETTALTHAIRGRGRREQAHALANLGLVHHALDAFEPARTRYQEALPLLREVGDVRAEVRTHARLGFLLHDLGDLAGAMAHYAEASRIDSARGLRLLEGTLTGYLGNLRRAEGRIEEAISIYEQAIARLRLVGDRRFEATFLMDRGIAQLIVGRHEDALRDLDLAAAIAGEIGSNGLGALALGYVVVARAACGDLAGARLAYEEERKATANNVGLLELLDVHATHIELAESKAGAALRARAMLRRMGDSVVGQHRRLAADFLQRAAFRAEPPDGAVVLRKSAHGHPDARELGKSSMRVPDGRWHDLGSKPAVARVVGLLIARRLACPGAIVGAGELVAVGWPGEKLVAGAGANRLRVLVNGLRNSGLKEVLRSADGGYFFDPNVLVVSD